MLKMDIVMKCDENGDLSVIVGTPTLFNARDTANPLSPTQMAELKRGSDMILTMIEVWIREEGILLDGGEMATFDPTIAAANPIPTVELFVNGLKHKQMEWPDVKRNLLGLLSGQSFMKLNAEEIEKAAG